jgi:uncharacterized protein YbjT (DUF2867 family)
MKIIVFGGTGKTGRHVVRQALDAGHQVTVFVRDPAGLDVQHDRVQVAVGQVTSDQEAVTAAVAGQDAAISALGSPRTLSGLRSPTIMSRALPVITRAMTDASVDRLVHLSSLGVGDSMSLTPPLLRVMYKAALGPVFADKAAGERSLRDSALDWTLVRPVMLTNGPHTGRCTAGESLAPTGLPRISRADVADFMLAQLQSPAYSRRTAVLTSAGPDR